MSSGISAWIPAALHTCRNRSAAAFWEGSTGPNWILAICPLCSITPGALMRVAM
jgi:hypothetical protein